MEQDQQETIQQELIKTAEGIEQLGGIPTVQEQMEETKQTQLDQTQQDQTQQDQTQQNQTQQELSKEQIEEELRKRQEIYDSLIQQCKQLNLDLISTGAKELDKHIFTLFTDEVMSKLVADLKEMPSPPDYATLNMLTNRGITYYGDDLYVLELMQDKDRFKSDDEMILYLSQFADLITRSQYKTEWYKKQIVNSKVLLTDSIGVVDFQAISNLAYYVQFNTDEETKEVSKEVMLHLVQRALQQFVRFKEKVRQIQLQESEKKIAPLQQPETQSQTQLDVVQEQE